MVKDVVLWADISELPDPIEKPEIAEGIPLRRKSKIFTYTLPLNRRQCLCSGLFEKYISDIYGFSTGDFGVDNNGKPQINNDIGINYSISHSNNIVICAVSRNNIGCDIEKIKTISSNIAERFFCEGEKAYLNDFSDSEFENEFFRLWTIKESYIKIDRKDGVKLPKDSYYIVDLIGLNVETVPLLLVVLVTYGFVVVVLP